MEIFRQSFCRRRGVTDPPAPPQASAMRVLSYRVWNFIFAWFRVWFHANCYMYKNQVIINWWWTPAESKDLNLIEIWWRTPLDSLDLNPIGMVWPSRKIFVGTVRPTTKEELVDCDIDCPTVVNIPSPSGQRATTWQRAGCQMATLRECFVSTWKKFRWPSRPRYRL